MSSITLADTANPQSGIQNPQSSELAISIEGLNVSYGDVKAVPDISLHVRQGEIFGIVGPDGAGKTTTLSAIEGLVKLNSAGGADRAWAGCPGAYGTGKAPPRSSAFRPPRSSTT